MASTYGYASPGGSGGSANASPFRTKLASKLGRGMGMPMGGLEQIQYPASFAEQKGDRLANMLQPGPPGPPNFDYGPPGPIPLRNEPPPGPPDFDSHFSNTNNVPNLPPGPGPEGPPELLMEGPMAPAPIPQRSRPLEGSRGFGPSGEHRYGYARGVRGGRLGPIPGANEDRGPGSTTRPRKIPVGQPVPPRRNPMGRRLGQMLV